MKSIKEMTPYEQFVLNKNIKALEEVVAKVKGCSARQDAIGLNLTLNRVNFIVNDIRQVMEIY